jgi:hypothetical protein
MKKALVEESTLILELRKVLWNKKEQVHNTVVQAEGLLSAKTQDATKYLDAIVKELATIKEEALPAFNPEWFPTVWRVYMAYGPSLENPHGHGETSGYLPRAC